MLKLICVYFLFCRFFIDVGLGLIEIVLFLVSFYLDLDIVLLIFGDLRERVK